ncbi:MAG: TIGR04053 family radical SAM/SPASM domain-containing protein [Nitrososphaerota archaeon]|jgi:radical SAM protein|nr:TIGR04053 family radical SAM/SPASM domain-containing protein [Nitrososphaerota archaeon]
MNFAEKPVLVFWETTKACPLSCVHCRASAILGPVPGELTTEEGLRVIDQVRSMGNPPPVLVFTGGDPLMRADLPELVAHAKGVGVPFAVSPAVSGNLTDGYLARLRDAGVSSISISLDGARPETHDSIRRVAGTFDRTIERIRTAMDIGVSVQVNTAIMKANLNELPEMLALIKGLGVKIWELFFLIQVGRGSEVVDLTPAEYESACNFAYDASRRGVVVRCVEAPFIRRVASTRRSADDYWQEETYLAMKRGLGGAEGGLSPSTLGPKGTLDGDGIVFVGHDGTIYPGGLLPVPLGNVAKDDLATVYRTDPLLKKIRGRAFSGPCGSCGYSGVCGGSRARAYARSGDPLGSDPACVFSQA